MDKAFLLLRLRTLPIIASILMEELLLFLHLIKCLWNEDARVEVFFISDMEVSNCASYIKK